MISHYDQKDFVTLYPGVYTEKEKALVDQYLADNRALEERGDVDARALIKGTLPEDTPGLGPSFAVTEAMVRYNNEKYDPENPVLNDPGYARSLGYEDVVAMSCFGAHDDTFNERGNPPLCQVYAALGREKEYEVKPATQEKRVMVVGGGPAGMETAVIAALRGQQVLLYEKEPKLGGVTAPGCSCKGFDREDTLALVNYYKTQLAKLRVETRLGQEVNRSWSKRSTRTC